MFAGSQFIGSSLAKRPVSRTCTTMHVLVSPHNRRSRIPIVTSFNRSGEMASFRIVAFLTGEVVKRIEAFCMEHSVNLCPTIKIDRLARVDALAFAGFSSRGACSSCWAYRPSAGHATVRTRVFFGLGSRRKCKLSKHPTTRK